MTINFCEVCLAVIICSIITIVLYIASWYNHEEKDEVESKVPGTSNIQGLENEKPVPRGEPNETINFDVQEHHSGSVVQPSGVIVKERSDLYRLQEEALRSHIAENQSGEPPIVDDYVTIDRTPSMSEYDPVVHSDAKNGRVHLSIKYDDERSKLVVQLLDAQGLIRPEQFAAPEMMLTYSLIQPITHEAEDEKHTRVVLENAAVSWKEPCTFCITFEQAVKENLHIKAYNRSDPAAVRDREVSIPLNNLGSHGEEINEWFDLTFVQSSS